MITENGKRASSAPDSYRVQTDRAARKAEKAGKVERAKAWLRRVRLELDALPEDSGRAMSARRELDDAAAALMEAECGGRNRRAEV